MEEIQKTFIFKKLDGTIITDVEQYVKNWLEDNKVEFPYSDIIVGCDSQIHGRRIKYSIVVCMHRVDRMKQGRGAHIVSCSIWEKRTKSQKEEMIPKLWKEAQYALLATQLVDSKNEMKRRITVHLDLNSNEDYASYAVYSGGMGMIRGMGYKVFGKPDSQVSSIVADHYAR